jgi:hypothetical protein
MKILYYINLFFVCCSSFIIQPSYSLVKYNNNINYNLIKLRKPLIFINGFNKNKKNNDIDIYDNEPITTKIIKKFINYIIIWIYINLLFSIIYEMKKMI